jgi:O-antigen/teichoic acid export membrane protein
LRQARGFLLNFTFLAAGDLAAKALSFLAFAHIARVIGTERFGDIAFAAALTLYFGLIVRQGLDVYAIQEVAQDHSRIRTLSASVLGLRLASSLAAAALLLLVVPLLAKPGQIKVLILLYGLSFFTSALS